MFDNPFDSFHSAAAEAKEERERLDRLLTISTPRERLLVVVISLIIAAFATWLFLGKVTHTLSVSGTVALPVEDVQVPMSSIEAHVWVRSEDVPKVTPDLTAAIEIAMANGETTAVDGRIASIAPVSIFGEMTPSHAKTPLTLQHVVITLTKDFEGAVAHGSNCRIFIELGRQSPISFFGMRPT